VIKLIELIQLAGIQLNDFKIHCATGTKTNPLEAFFDGTFRQWQEDQTQKNFQTEHILSLIHLHGTEWLFAGVYSVLGVKPVRRKDSVVRFRYDTRELKGLDHLTGRAVIEFEKTFRASYLRGEKYINQLLVKAIRDQRMTVGDFPGYNSVVLSYALLGTITRESIPSWKAALSNVAGVYLITDTKTGRQYVGGAYGGEGIWQRWKDYVKTGHGGNRNLRELLRLRGQKYSHHFQFSLLEICDLNSSEEYIFARESHWKNVLKSREFGMNYN
jgi:hypothetical protein